MVRGGGGECYGPVAVRTRLGYVLSGPVNMASPIESHSSVNVSHVMKTEYRSLEGNCIQLPIDGCLDISKLNDSCTGDTELYFKLKV